MQLNDTHLVLLSAAAQREDRLLARPDKLGAQAIDKLAARFEAAGLVEAIAVTAQQPHWRTGPDGEAIGLGLTTAGYDALGIEPEGVGPDGAATVTGEAAESPPDQARQHGTKRALLIAMLQREEGASVEAIMAATGWLPHSTRAALTGLRKAGHSITRGKDDAGRSVYRVIDPSHATGPLNSDTAE
jgi:hypothetical protein